MICAVSAENRAAFETACRYERVFGSKCLAALRAYGAGGPAAFYVDLDEAGAPASALAVLDDVLVMSSNNRTAPAELAAFLRQNPNIGEVDSNFDQCAAVQALLGGELESSYYMRYLGGPIPGDFSGMTGEYDLHQIFSVLQQSHEYYRAHLQLERWAADLTRKLSRGLMELYQLNADGCAVGTGSIVSEDDACGVIAAVAVVPAYRGRGLGTRISRFLVNRILEKGKTPLLISGYDAVAELYRKVGFCETGRWGELYL